MGLAAGREERGPHRPRQALRRSRPARRIPDAFQAGPQSDDQAHQRVGPEQARGRSHQRGRRSPREARRLQHPVRPRVVDRPAARSWTASRASTVATRAPCVPIEIRTGVLPRTHGSALFTRGETQALVVATLGNRARPRQRIDALMGEFTDPFMLHYKHAPVRHRRDGSRRHAEASRDRPRPPGQARAARVPAAGRRVQLLDPPGVGKSPNRNGSSSDGVGVRRLPGADGPACR